MGNVNILMATYNGAKYIDKQIFSIITQTYQNWRLIIHDDGSTDNTVEIIKQLCEIDTRIIFIEDEYVAKNAGLHFMYMLRFAEAPFICFCDQDDIWIENKLQKMVDVIECMDNTKPQVVFSDAYLLHDQTNVINGRLLFVKPHRLKEILYTNGGVHGSASMFNMAMKNSIDRKYTSVVMHDHILTLAGCTVGHISFMNDKLFLYRQHQQNVTGNMYTNPITRIFNAFFSHKKKFTLSMNTIDGVTAFVEAYQSELSEQDLKVISEYLNFVNMNSIIRFFKIVKGGYSLGNSMLHLWIKILTRKYIDK